MSDFSDYERKLSRLEHEGAMLLVVMHGWAQASTKHGSTYAQGLAAAATHHAEEILDYNARLVAFHAESA